MNRKLSAFGLALILAIVFYAPAAAQDGDAEPKAGAYCDGTAEKQHPVAARIATEGDLSYEEVIGLFCQGYGFGQIKKAVALSELTGEGAAVLLAEKTETGGWGAVWKARGIGGPPPHARAKHNKPPKEPKGNGGD